MVDCGKELTSRSLHNEFVKSHALTTSLGDSSASGLGEAEGSNVDLGHVEESLVISDGGNRHDSAVSLSSEVLDDLRKGERRTVGSAGEKSSEDGLCEGGVSSAGQESEQLHTRHKVEHSKSGGNLP